MAHPATADRSAPAAPVCCPPHHMLIETPSGPWCRGRCKKCGLLRVYASAGDEDMEFAATMSEKRRRSIAKKRGAKRGGAVTAAQARQFYGPVAQNTLGSWSRNIA